jgi:hypothetical protein
VAGNVVAEVDRPGESGRSAVGVVGEAGEKTSDPADGDAEGEGDGVEVASGFADSDVAFREFDGNETEGEGADDGFASDDVVGIVQMLPGELGVFEPEEEFGAECGSGDRGRDDGPAEWGDDGVSEAAAEGEVDAEGDDVGEGLEEKVRVDGVGAEVEIEREGDGMG